MRHKTHTFSDCKYTSGDQVYYKNPRKGKEWFGPATVMGQNGSLVLVQDGGFFYRVHQCHLLKLSESEPCREKHPISEEENKPQADQEEVRNAISNSLSSEEEEVAPQNGDNSGHESSRVPPSNLSSEENVDNYGQSSSVPPSNSNHEKKNKAKHLF